MEIKRTGFHLKSYVQYYAKNRTAKWKDRNLFSYSVLGMSQVVSTKKRFGLGKCKFVASNFPTDRESNSNRHHFKAKKVYLKPTLQCIYVNTAIREITNCNICILAFTKNNKNNCYNLTGRVPTASPIKHTDLVPVRLWKENV